MHAAPLTSDLTAAWNGVASESAEAWFWHTTDWLGFVRILGGKCFLEDLSLMIYDDRTLLAICPIVLEEREGYRRFSYLGEFVPSPAFLDGVETAQRRLAIECYVEQLDALAAAHDVAYARVAVPVLASTAPHEDGAVNLLLRHGFLDVAAASQVVSLTAPEDALRRDMRKGHRSDVRRASERCEVVVWDKTWISEEKFAEYRELHARDAGRVTREEATFDIMLEWIRRGVAVLFEACREGQAVAFSLVILFRDGAYYASSCKDPASGNLPSMHLIQWETIRWLKMHGFRRYDLGPQYFGARWDHVPTAKELSIARFKRGFGGATRRMDVVERFYSAEVCQRVGEARVRAMVASL
jgi:hypothetical protein